MTSNTSLAADDLASAAQRDRRKRSPRSPSARCRATPALVAWVTGRSSATETAEHVETAVRLLLRD